MQNSFRIKICGVTNAADAIDVVESGADAIGLNFYPQGKRYLSPDQEQEVVQAIRNASAMTDRGTGPAIIGVFVNEAIDALVDKVLRLELDGVQLHGDETPEIMATIRCKLESAAASHQRRNNIHGVTFIRAIRTAPRGTALKVTALKGEGSPMDADAVDEAILAWSKAGVDAVLIDAASAGAYGGTGKQVDWHQTRSLKSSLPVILAGGLRPDNIADAIATAAPAAVDVASGVESSPGKKCKRLTNEFVANAEMAFAQKG